MGLEEAPQHLQRELWRMRLALLSEGQPKFTGRNVPVT
jgi:hypothetical protein